MRDHESAIILLGAALLIAALMAAFAQRPAPAVALPPAGSRDRAGIIMVDGAARIDVNRADAALLMELPGVGEALARAIIAGRPYARAEDLLKVKGIGASKLNGMRDQVAIEWAGGRTGRPPHLTPQSPP